MNCEEIKEMLDAYADGFLNIEEAGLLEEHLASCTDCETALQQIIEVKTAVSNLSQLKAPSSFKEALMDRIDSQEPVVVEAIPAQISRSRVQFFSLGIAASILIIGITGYLLYITYADLDTRTPISESVAHQENKTADEEADRSFKAERSREDLSKRALILQDDDNQKTELKETESGFMQPVEAMKGQAEDKKTMIKKSVNDLKKNKSSDNSSMKDRYKRSVKPRNGGMGRKSLGDIKNNKKILEKSNDDLVVVEKEDEEVSEKKSPLANLDAHAKETLDRTISLKTDLCLVMCESGWTAPDELKRSATAGGTASLDLTDFMARRAARLIMKDGPRAPAAASGPTTANPKPSMVKDQISEVDDEWEYLVLEIESDSVEKVVSNLLKSNPDLLLGAKISAPEMKRESGVVRRASKIKQISYWTINEFRTKDKEKPQAARGKTAEFQAPPNKGVAVNSEELTESKDRSAKVEQQQDKKEKQIKLTQVWSTEFGNSRNRKQDKGTAKTKQELRSYSHTTEGSRTRKILLVFPKKKAPSTSPRLKQDEKDK